MLEIGEVRNAANVQNNKDPTFYCTLIVHIFWIGFDRIFVINKNK